METISVRESYEPQTSRLAFTQFAGETSKGRWVFHGGETCRTIVCRVGRGGLWLQHTSKPSDANTPSTRFQKTSADSTTEKTAPLCSEAERTLKTEKSSHREMEGSLKVNNFVTPLAYPLSLHCKGRNCQLSISCTVWPEG